MIYSEKISTDDYHRGLRDRVIDPMETRAYRLNSIVRLKMGELTIQLLAWTQHVEKIGSEPNNYSIETFYLNDNKKHIQGSPMFTRLENGFWVPTPNLIIPVGKKATPARFVRGYLVGDPKTDVNEASVVSLVRALDRDGTIAA